MTWGFILAMLGLTILYYVLTSPEERIKAAERRHENNKKLLGGGFGILGAIFRRLR